MAKKNFTPEQIINKLREAEIHINQGISISEASRKIGSAYEINIARRLLKALQTTGGGQIPQAGYFLEFSQNIIHDRHCRTDWDTLFAFSLSQCPDLLQDLRYSANRPTSLSMPQLLMCSLKRASRGTGAA